MKRFAVKRSIKAPIGQDEHIIIWRFSNGAAAYQGLSGSHPSPPLLQRGAAGQSLPKTWEELWGCLVSNERYIYIAYHLVEKWVSIGPNTPLFFLSNLTPSLFLSGPPYHALWGLWAGGYISFEKNTFVATNIGNSFLFWIDPYTLQESLFYIFFIEIIVYSYLNSAIVQLYFFWLSDYNIRKNRSIIYV